MQYIEMEIPSDNGDSLLIDFISLTEWGDLCSYQIKENDFVKIAKIKSDEKFNEKLDEIKESAMVEDLVVTEEDNHYLIYVRLTMSKLDDKYSFRKILDLEKKGVLFFEELSYDGKVERIGIGCEDSFSQEVIEYFKKNFNAELESIENYTPSNDPLSDLTTKQLKTLMIAYKKGYYEVPKNTTLDEIALELDTNKSVISEHLRKAENKLLNKVL